MPEEQHERITGEWKYSDYTPSSISTTAGSETKNAHRSERQKDIGEQFYCSYDGMLDVRSYKHSHQDIDEYFKFLTE